ncbi:MAG: hypothetical protein WBV22_13160 [Anaerolineaceae bacterium]
MRLIHYAGMDLEAFVDNINGGHGWEWIITNTHGTRIHRGGLPAIIAAQLTRLPTSLVFPLKDIWLAEHFDTFPSPKRHFLHELGHVIDNRLPKKGIFPHTIFGKGAADRLVINLGGKPSGLRFCNGSSGIPDQYHWWGTGVYGNHSTADYFAEGFSWLPYDPTKLPDPLVTGWFNSEIFLGN